MTGQVARLLARYGQPVTLTAADGAQTQVRAFLRLVSSRNRETFARTWTGLGELPTGRVLLLCPPTPALTGIVSVSAQGAAYLVRRSAGVMLGGQVIYQWGLLSPGGA